MTRHKRRRSSDDFYDFTPQEQDLIATAGAGNNTGREERKVKTRIILRNQIHKDTGHIVPLEKINSTKPPKGPWRVIVSGEEAKKYPVVATSKITEKEFELFQQFISTDIRVQWRGAENEYVTELVKSDEEEDFEEEDFEEEEIIPIAKRRKLSVPPSKTHQPTNPGTSNTTTNYSHGTTTTSNGIAPTPFNGVSTTLPNGIIATFFNGTMTMTPPTGTPPTSPEDASGQKSETLLELENFVLRTQLADSKDTIAKLKRKYGEPEDDEGEEEYEDNNQMTEIIGSNEVKTMSPAQKKAFKELLMDNTLKRFKIQSLEEEKAKNKQELARMKEKSAKNMKAARGKKRR